jgi:Domain of unknown function (DUF4118)
MTESINISRLRGPSTLLRYGLAVLAVSAATIIQQFGDEHFAVTPSYFCAVLLTAWLGELGPALFAIALSNLALAYYFVPPTRTFFIDAKYISSLMLFFLQPDPDQGSGWPAAGRQTIQATALSIQRDTPQPHGLEKCRR